MNAAKLALLNMAGYKVSQQGRDKLYVPIVGEKGVRYRGTFDTPAAAIASGRPVHFDTWASFEACAEFLNNKLDGGSAVAGIAAVANLNPNPRKSRMWLQLILVGALFALLAVALLAVDTTVVALLAVALPAVALPVVLLHPTPVALTSVKRCVSFGHFLYMFFLLVGVGVLAALLAVDPQGAQVPTWMVLNDGLLLTLSVFFIYSLASSTTSLYHSAHVYEDALKKDSWVATNLSLTQTQRKMGAHNRGTLERLKKEGVGRAPPWPALMRTLNTTGCWISPVNVNVATLVEWMGSGDGELPRNYSDGASSRRIGGFSDFESVVDPHNQASQKRWTRRIHDRSAAELAVVSRMLFNEQYLALLRRRSQTCPDPWCKPHSPRPAEQRPGFRAFPPIRGVKLTPLTPSCAHRPGFRAFPPSLRRLTRRSRRWATNHACKACRSWCREIRSTERRRLASTVTTRRSRPGGLV